MTFLRTNSGLSNLHLFVRADIVVFVEGGKSYSCDDVDSGLYNSNSSDIRFWQVLFSIYRPEKDYKFRAVGSKEVVKIIAQEIKSGHVSKVVVAMDRDFDHINSRIISSDNVLYTFGYSWENDCWSDTTILQAYCSLSGSCNNYAANKITFIKEAISQFSRSLHGAVYLDAILSQYGSSLFDRKKHGRYISLDTYGMPSINMSQIKLSIGQARNVNPRPILRKTPILLEVLKDCLGHLLADYGFRLLSYLLKKTNGLPKVPKEYAASMLVEKFGQALSEEEYLNVRNHYDLEFSRVTN